MDFRVDVSEDEVISRHPDAPAEEYDNFHKKNSAYSCILRTSITVVVARTYFSYVKAHEYSAYVLRGKPYACANDKHFSTPVERWVHR